MLPRRRHNASNDEQNLLDRGFKHAAMTALLTRLIDAKTILGDCARGVFEINYKNPKIQQEIQNV